MEKDKKISELEELNAITGNEFIPVSIGGTNKKIKTELFKGNVQEAPKDGKTYGRNNGQWSEIVGGEGGSIVVDTEMSDSSTNTVQNKVIKSYVDSNNTAKILEWNTDVATTRKQVPLNSRKYGLQIGYKHPDEGWVYETFISKPSSFSDSNWTIESNWLKQITLNDINKTTYLIEGDITNAVSIPSTNRAFNQMVVVKVREKNSWLLTINGTAETEGTIEIKIGDNTSVVNVSIGDTYTDILNNIHSSDDSNFTTEIIGNSIIITEVNYESSINVVVSTITGVTVRSAKQTTNSSYLYYRYIYNTKTNLNDNNYKNAGCWLLLGLYNPYPMGYEDIFITSELVFYPKDIQESDSYSYNLYMNKGLSRVYFRNITNMIYTDFSGIVFNIPSGYVLGLSHPGLSKESLVVLRKTSDMNNNYIPLFTNKEGKYVTPSGLFYYYFKNKTNEILYLDKNILFGNERLKGVYNSDGSITVDRISDATYSNYLFLSYGYPTNSKQIQLSFPIQVPKYTALVYNIITETIEERKYGITNNPEYHNVPVGSNEILLIANSVSRIQGGVLVDYIRRNEDFEIPRKILPTPKRIYSKGSTQGIFIWDDNLCLCSHSNDEHTDFVNNSIIQ